MNVSKGSAPWGLLIAAVFFALIAISFFVLYDQFPELSSIDDEYGLMENLEEMGGKTAVAGFFGLFAAGFGAWGLYRLVAQRQASATPLTLSRQELNIALQVGLEFTDSDLAANKRGEMSPAQHQKLGKNLGVSRRVSAIVTVVVLLLFVGAIVFLFFLSPGAENLRQEALDEPSSLVILGSVLGVTVLLMLIGIIPALRNSNPDRLKIEQTEGNVRVTIHESRYGAACQLRVNRKVFYLTENQARSFWNGGSYRLYYVRFSRILIPLSGEYLG